VGLIPRRLRPGRRAWIEYTGGEDTPGSYI
jgi:hypothetical protein